MPRRNKHSRIYQRLVENQQWRLKTALANILKVKEYEVDEHTSRVVLGFHKGFERPKYVGVTPHGKYYYDGQSYGFSGIVNRLGLLNV